MSMQQLKPTIRLHIWLENEEGIVFGSGRAQLMLNIERYGSLKKAAEAMKMSYRAAWGKIKQTETILGHKLIRKMGSNRKGYELTAFGTSITRNFLYWFDEVEKKALKEAESIFPWLTNSYKNTSDIRPDCVDTVCPWPEKSIADKKRPNVPGNAPE